MSRMASTMPAPIAQHVVDSAVQLFKLAANNNFIQGRRMHMVAAVCLYTSCRKEKPCKVMLIDFADYCQVRNSSYLSTATLLTVSGECFQTGSRLQSSSR